ncbi:MAG: phage holin family protein [Chitinophagaceae bacterium]|nr:phage holin family protein [Chitinophagaceae bacterium]
MENIKEEFENLLKQSQEYADTRIELFKLQSVDKLSDVVSSVLSRMVVILIAGLFIVLVSIALSLLIGDLLGKSYYGFFIIAGFYALIGLICSVYRHQLFKGPIAASMIKKMLNS